MAGPSKVIVLDPDARAGRQIQLGFQREGLEAHIAAVPPDLRQFELPVAPGGGPGLVVVGGGSNGAAVDLVRRTRELLQANHADIPIVFAGSTAGPTLRQHLLEAGADEVIPQPAYLRDVVTIGRLLVDQPASQRTHLVGNLADVTSVLALVRALSALGRSATLTLIRGLRRGEVRFFEGEVTSAQVGLIHGQAALHQLLLWTDARFDYHHEDIPVRRQQIPLDHDELFADAERFLAGIRESAGPLSPSMVLEQDIARIQALGKQIPTEVHGVLRMFDGHRVLADVLEDSPYRVFETLRVAQRAVDVGLLRQNAAPRPKATWRAVLAIEEWLVGSDTREDALARSALDNSVPITKVDASTSNTSITGKQKKFNKRQRKKKRAHTPLPMPPPPASKNPTIEIDWGALVPRTVGQEVGPLSGVVPAAQRSGEIVLPRAPSREEPREGLEQLMSTTQRERFFPSDLGGELAGAGAAPASAEASVVLDQASSGQASSDRASADRAQAEDAERATAALAMAQATKAAAAAAEAKQLAEADALARSLAEARARSEAETKAKAAAQAEADAMARREAEAQAALAKAEADAAAARAEAAAALAKAEADAARAKAEADAARAKAEADAARAKAEADAADARAQAATSGEINAASSTITTSTDLVRALLDEARTEPTAAPAATPSTIISSSDASGATGELTTASTIVSETPAVQVAVHDRLAVERTAQTARIVATPETTVSEVPFLAKPTSTADDSKTRTFEKPSIEVDHAQLQEIDDGPSDGVIRTQHEEKQSATTGAARRPPPGEIPVDDRPPQTKGEIRGRRASTPPPVTGDEAEPSILVADLQAAHAAVSAVATEQAAASSPAPNAAAAAGTPGTPVATASAEVAQVRRDATAAFTQLEEDFFRAGTAHENEAPAPQSSAKPRLASASDSFDDLDEGYERVGFWDRLLGRKKKR